MTLRREIRLLPSYDRTQDPKGNFGVHNAEMAFLLRGAEGTLVWCFYTDWWLPHLRQDHLCNSRHCAQGSGIISLHLSSPPGRLAESDYDFTHNSEPCSWVSGDSGCWAKIVSDFSTQSPALFNLLVAEGVDSVWTKLEALWKEIFG